MVRVIWQAGIWICVGLGVCSPISMAMALLGSTLGLFTGMFFGADKSALFFGLWGYNSVLACIAIGGYFFVMSPKTLAMASVGAVLCAVLQGAMIVLLAPVGMPTLTIPFCLGAIVLGSVYNSFPGYTPIPLPNITVPEAHIVEAMAARAAKKKALASKRRRLLYRLLLLMRAVSASGMYDM